MNFQALGILATAPPAGGGGLLQNPIVPLVVVVVIFYFLVFAPERKRRKQHASMLQALKPGDRVLTSGGMYGRVVGVADDKVQLRIADQVQIEIARNAISGRLEE
jgi:preprotein translocase subunit YajC